MTTKYQNSRDVPLDTIIARLRELADAVTGGSKSQEREFTMRIPAECDRDADLVIDEAARRLADIQSENEAMKAAEVYLLNNNERLREKNAAFRKANKDLRRDNNDLRDQVVDWQSALIQAREYGASAASEVEALRARVAELEAGIKNAIGWIDGDLREIVRDVGNQICSYNDLYESADRIEFLLAGALRQQADELEKAGGSHEA